MRSLFLGEDEGERQQPEIALLTAALLKAEGGAR
jgi:hypothetical protein